MYFWFIFVRTFKAWQPSQAALGGFGYKAYRTQREAKKAIIHLELRQKFGRGNVRLYKFKPEASILGFN